MREDLIKRSDAMATIEKRKEKIVSNYESNKWFRKMISEVEAIPSADRPQGEWIIEIDINNYTYGRCSICGMRQYAGHLNFCPNCGADMRKGADDETD